MSVAELVFRFISAQVEAPKAENLTENVVNATTKPPSTPEGMFVAYGSLVIMAILPIYFGSYRSVHYHKENVRIVNRNISQISDLKFQKAEKMTSKDAAIFPIMASVALFSLYIVFKLFSKEYINMLLTGYFFFLGVLALTHLLRYACDTFAHPVCVDNLLLFTVQYAVSWCLVQSPTFPIISYSGKVKVIKHQISSTTNSPPMMWFH